MQLPWLLLVLVIIGIVMVIVSKLQAHWVVTHTSQILVYNHLLCAATLHHVGHIAKQPTVLYNCSTPVDYILAAVHSSAVTTQFA